MSVDSVTHILLATNLLLLLAALYWTSAAWLRMRDLSLQPPWSSRSCILHSKSLSASRGFWRADFIVSNFSISSPAQNATAYRYGTSVYNQTHANASDFAAEFDNGKSYPCWLAEDKPPWHVALEPVHPGPSRSDTDVALMSTLLLAVSAFSLLVALTSVLKRKAVTRLDVSHAAGAVSAPGEAVRETLSPRQIDRLCRAKEGAERIETEVCAICLDDDKEMVDAVTLPCRHPFHDGCIRAWLLRGGVTCPLCCYKLSEAGLVSAEVEEQADGAVAVAGAELLPERSGGDGEREGNARRMENARRVESLRESSHGEDRRRASDGCADVGLD